MRSLAGVAALLGLAAAGCRQTPTPAQPHTAQSQPHPIIHLSTYADLRHDVSLSYAAPWALTRRMAFPLAGPPLELHNPPSAAVSLSREDAPHLASTDFAGAELVYAVRPRLDASACAALAGQQTAELGGIAFHLTSSSRTSVPYARADRLYSTLHKGNCLLFDLALLRLASGSTRPMSAAQQAEVDQELDQILGSLSLE